MKIPSTVKVGSKEYVVRVAEVQDADRAGYGYANRDELGGFLVLALALKAALHVFD